MPYRKALRFKANSFFVRRKTGCGIAPETRRVGGGSILRFASELKNMLLHTFVWKAKASAEAAGAKRIGTARAASFSGGQFPDCFALSSSVRFTTD